MKILFGLHNFGIVMWMGGLITALRLLILHPKECLQVRSRFLYLESGFLRFTALPGICITLITGFLLLYFSIGFNLLLYTQELAIKLCVYLVMILIHALVVIQFNHFSQRAIHDQNDVNAFMIEHKVLLCLTIAILIL